MILKFGPRQSSADTQTEVIVNYSRKKKRGGVSTLVRCLVVLGNYYYGGNEIISTAFYI